MNNEITINPEEILLLPDNSITDSETIRQIALYSIKYNDISLNGKIKKEYEYCGLYPHVMTPINVFPDNMDNVDHLCYLDAILELFKLRYIKK